MRIFSINSVPYGSTARIMLGISEQALEFGHIAVMATGYSSHPLQELENKYIKIGNIADKQLHTTLSKITGKNGCFSRFATKKLIKHIKKCNPDILHLHNVHGWYLHLPTLFDFIKKSNIQVVWTLHDCWTFTGKCAHFEKIGCEKWKTGCFSCPQLREYPQSYVDCSKSMYQKKKEWFTGVENLTIVTPSAWLADLVKQSFLQEYPVKIIQNGINLSVFSPTASDFKKRYGIEGKHLILGVSLGWSDSKGLDVFVELAKRLGEEYAILLVGTDEKTDKLLPKNVISIHRTQNVKELAELYSAADVLVNPTREDTFPTVNIEALACGTPVVTFRSGGSPECIDESCGVVVEKNNVDEMERQIKRVCEDKPFTKEACVARAKQFDKKNKFNEYVKLYEKLKG